MFDSYSKRGKTTVKEENTNAIFMNILSTTIDLIHLKQVDLISLNYCIVN